MLFTYYFKTEFLLHANRLYNFFFGPFESPLSFKIDCCAEKFQLNQSREGRTLEISFWWKRVKEFVKLENIEVKPSHCRDKKIYSYLGYKMYDYLVVIYILPEPATDMIFNS